MNDLLAGNNQAGPVLQGRLPKNDRRNTFPLRHTVRPQPAAVCLVALQHNAVLRHNAACCRKLSGSIDGWNVYGADLLPGDVTLDIDGSGNGFSGGADTAINTIIVDPDITGNTLLTFSSIDIATTDAWDYDGDIAGVRLSVGLGCCRG